MKTFRVLRGIGISLAVALGAAVSPAEELAPPKTAAEAIKETLHGVELVDPYRWLEEQNSPETRAWIGEQNAFSRSVLDELPGRDAIAKRLEELLRIDSVGVPRERGGRYFFTRRSKDADLPVLYVRRGAKGADEVLIDPRPLSADGSVSITLLDISEDGRRIAYGVRTGGEDEVVVKFRDVETRTDLADSLERARYSGVAFGRTADEVFYSRRVKEGPRVYRHRMGSPAAEDAKIFGDGIPPEKIVSISTWESRWLVATILHGSAATKTEIYAQDLTQPKGTLRPIVTGIEARFTAVVGGDTIYLNTNWNAPNGRVLGVSLANPGAPETWREVVRESGGTIQSLAAVGGRLFVNTIQDVRETIRIFRPTGNTAGTITFETLGSLGVPSGRWRGGEAFFTFSSFTTPTEVWRYSVSSAERTVWARPQVNFDPSGYEVTQAWYPSKDGTRIPMFLAHKKGISLDGANPTYLYGYGGFTVSQLPSFSALKAVWMERGGVYALANLRGGGEFGEAWHKAGMLEKKQNTFDDFIAAAEWLIKKRYTSPKHLAIGGGSNGGLLVGAAMTQRPDLFSGVVCSYPLLDMVRYHKFLVAGYWVPEYGSSEKPEQFAYLRAYSPYHNVKAGGEYPSVLLITGDSDTRVAPLHARKMAALLQSEARTVPGEPVLLLYDTKAGHTRGSNTPVPKQVAEMTDELSFLLWQTGAKSRPN
jgi:prolyl oligopeptidase